MAGAFRSGASPAEERKKAGALFLAVALLCPPASLPGGVQSQPRAGAFATVALLQPSYASHIQPTIRTHSKLALFVLGSLVSSPAKARAEPTMQAFVDGLNPKQRAKVQQALAVLRLDGDLATAAGSLRRAGLSIAAINEFLMDTALRSNSLDKTLRLGHLIGRFGAAGVLRRLVSLLRHPRQDWRRMAALGLGRADPLELQRALKDEGLLTPPERVLPGTRGSRRKVLVLVLDAFEGKDREHGPRVRKRIEKTFGNAPVRIENVPFSRRTAADQIRGLVRDNPHASIVVNGSISDSPRDPLHAKGIEGFSYEFLREMGELGVLFVFSAGNDNGNLVQSHPPLENVFYVAALDRRQGPQARISNVGPVEFVRFVVDVTGLNESTSLAAAKITGRIAERLARQPHAAERDILRALTDGAKPSRRKLFKLLDIARIFMVFLTLSFAAGDSFQPSLHRAA